MQIKLLKVPSPTHPQLPQDCWFCCNGLKMAAAHSLLGWWAGRWIGSVYAGALLEMQVPSRVKLPKLAIHKTIGNDRRALAGSEAVM